MVSLDFASRQKTIDKMTIWYLPRTMSSIISILFGFEKVIYWLFHMLFNQFEFDFEFLQTIQCNTTQQTQLSSMEPSGHCMNGKSCIGIINILTPECTQISGAPLPISKSKLRWDTLTSLSQPNANKQTNKQYFK